MSFRGRLTLFFLLIVVLPMIAVAVLVTQVTTQSRNGKADARLAAGLGTALTVYRDDMAQARRATSALGHDPALGAALQTGDSAQVAAAARSASRSRGCARSSCAMRAEVSWRRSVVRPWWRPTASTFAGPRAPSARSWSRPRRPTPTSRRSSISRAVTGRFSAPAGRSRGRSTWVTRAFRRAATPATSRSTARSFASVPRTSRGRPAAAWPCSGPAESAGFFSSSPLVAAVLVAFFAVALVFVAMLLRALGGQVAAMLDAARRIGQGDFSHKVPVVGKDEMAGLASEFNKMSDRLRDPDGRGAPPADRDRPFGEPDRRGVRLGPGSPGACSRSSSRRRSRPARPSTGRSPSAAATGPRPRRASSDRASGAAVAAAEDAALRETTGVREDDGSCALAARCGGSGSLRAPWA